MLAAGIVRSEEGRGQAALAAGWGTPGEKKARTGEDFRISQDCGPKGRGLSS